MKGKRSFSVPVGVIYSWETARLIHCGMWGGLWCPHLGVTFTQNSSVSAATDGRGHGDKRIQMRDISEMDSVGRRGMTGTGSVEERKSPVTSKALRGLEGSIVPQPFFLLCFRSSFPKIPQSWFNILEHAGGSAPWGQELWLPSSPQCSYPPIRVQFWFPALRPQVLVVRRTTSRPGGPICGPSKPPQVLQGRTRPSPLKEDCLRIDFAWVKQSMRLQQHPRQSFTQRQRNWGVPFFCVSSLFLFPCSLPFLLLLFNS